MQVGTTNTACTRTPRWTKDNTTKICAVTWDAAPREATQRLNPDLQRQHDVDHLHGYVKQRVSIMKQDSELDDRPSLYAFDWKHESKLLPHRTQHVHLCNI